MAHQRAIHSKWLIDVKEAIPTFARQKGFVDDKMT